jgi:hypothetical protein
MATAELEVGNNLVDAILDWWQDQSDDGHRPHLGASIIGHPCERHLWNVFRWVRRQRWEGRMLRLFDDGKRAESRFVQELTAIGCEVWADDGVGAQFRVSTLGGHFGGSVDAVARGLPHDPQTAHVCEFKTSNDKAFKELLKKRVATAKPMHHAQMQIYMGLLGLSQALYLVENKNDASLYSEVVSFDGEVFARLLAKAERIIAADQPPPRIADSADDLNCRFCQFAPLCHGQQTPEVNCRTCCHSTPVTEGAGATGGQWMCQRAEPQPIDPARQRLGCEQHLYIPPLLRNVGEAVDGDQASVTYRTTDGSRFVNGPPPGFSSIEIHHCEFKPMLSDPLVQQLKQEFSTARLLGATALMDMPSDDLDQVPTKREHPKQVEGKRRARATLEALKSSTR